MKIVAKPIDVVACFIKRRQPMPYKFKLTESDTNLEIKVDKILKVEESMIAGIEAFIYTCQSEINGIRKLYELKYDKSACQWELYKM